MAESKLNPLLYVERETSSRNLCCGIKNLFEELFATMQTLKSVERYSRKILVKMKEVSVVWITFACNHL